jgi:phage terminase large subunit-like protein
MVPTHNSGHDKNSVCWAEHEYSVKVARGDLKNDSWFSYVCALDPGDDPFESEACWIKANPTLGVTIHREFLREQVREAKGMPSKENIVRRLHFCQWTDAAEGWISRAVWEAIETKADMSELDGRVCYGGLDMSYSRDLTACAWVIPAEDGTFDAFVDFWKPKDEIREAIKRDMAPYDVWASEGHLNLSDGKVIKLGPIGMRMAEIAGRFELGGIAYDKYRHKELADNLHDLGIELPLIEHPQGFRRMGKLDEIGPDGKPMDNPLWMPQSFQQLENLIVEGKIRVRYNPVLRWNAASAVIRQDPAGTDNRIFDKRKSSARIDGIVALAMAVGLAYARAKVQTGSVYETRGVLSF